MLSWSAGILFCSLSLSSYKNSNGNFTVTLVYCSFSCKIKNFEETGVAFLASVRVLFCFHEGYRNTVSCAFTFLHFRSDLLSFALIVSSLLNLDSIPSSVSLARDLGQEGTFNWLVLKIHRNQLLNPTEITVSPLYSGNSKPS